MLVETFSKRYLSVCVFFVVVMVIFIQNLIQLQIVDGAEYKERAEKRLLAPIAVRAQRGEILDRYGRPLVVNKIGYSINISKTDSPREEFHDTLLRLIDLAARYDVTYMDSLPITQYPFEFTFSDSDDATKEQKALNWARRRGLIKEDATEVTAQEIIDKLSEKYKISTEYDADSIRKLVGIRNEMELRMFSVSAPFTFATKVSGELVLQLEEQHLDFPGVSIVTEPLREYMYDNLASHILGRVGIIYKDEYDELKKYGYGMNDIIGKDGMEKYLEEDLKGKDGYDSIEITINGITTNLLQREQPQPGNYAFLTLDIEMQKVLEQSLADTIESIRQIGLKDTRRKGADVAGGASVVVDVNTGEILAIATYPTYNIKTFNEDYTTLMNDNLKPMLNRAVGGTYSPGSTYKMVTAVAGLEDGKVTVSERIRDEGRYRLDASYAPACWIFNDYGTTHGLQNVSQAVANSCNYYFFEVGKRLGIDRINHYAVQFGLGKPTGIEIGESKGILASPEYKKQMNDTWYPGNTLQAAIGQSDNMFTPVQLASYIAALANRGSRYKLHLLKSVRTFGEGKLKRVVEPEVLSFIDMKPETINAVLEGMKGVTEDGTASSDFKNFPISVGGKTGSAEVDMTGKKSANGLFVAFAPFDNPQIAVVSVVEHAAHGRYLAPIAKDVFTYYFGLDKESNDDFSVNVLS